MTHIPDPSDGDAVQIQSKLVWLQEQTESARTALALLEQEINAAESGLSDSRAVQLVEANEQLVLAILRAQSDAEQSALALQEAVRMTAFDTLTELPNRAQLLDRLSQAIGQAKRRNTRLGLLFLDLNDFKQINDSLGQAAGDQVLKFVAHSLSASVRNVDTVSRHGGDEFLILLAEVFQASDAERIATKMIAALGVPTRIGDHVLHLRASIGISLYPDHGEDAQTLIESADTAMYRAKHQGGGSIVYRSDDIPRVQKPRRQWRPPQTPYERGLADDQRQSNLREANEHLILAAVEAQELRSDLEQSQRRQMEFLAVLAHELRNPLGPIRAAAAMLDSVDTGAPLLATAQAIIERQVTHMARLVGDLLDVSRVSTGKLRLEYQFVEIVAIINEAIDTCQPAMVARHQHFFTQVPAGPLPMHGDPVRLMQILCNLLDNASKYTPKEGYIELTAKVIDAGLIITVSDSGIGIAAESLPQMFELFAREKRAADLNSNGLGIGLAVVRELVEAHAGTVVAFSAGSGLGSQFVITLPLGEHGQV